MSDAAVFGPLVTPRLVLRPFHPGDLEAFLAYRNDPAVARYQGWAVPVSAAAARAFLAENAAPQIGAPGRGAQIAIALAATDELVGDLFFGPYGSDGRQGMLGYSLARQHQGRGYATEAARALLDYVFVPLGLHRVVATVDTRNFPSTALLERLGMRREGHFRACYFDEQTGAWTDEYLYAVLRDEWLTRAGGAADAQL